MLIFRCPRCNKKVGVHPGKRRVKCPGCHQIMPVPDDAEEASAPDHADMLAAAMPTRPAFGDIESQESLPPELHDDGFLRFACGRCQYRLKAKPEHIGKQTACPKCQTPVTVPELPR